MADSFLDKSGLSYLWSKIKQYFVEKETGKGLSTNDYTDAEKAKIANALIPADSDLNDITDIGWYRATTTTAASLANCPVTTGFYMEVKIVRSASGRYQHIVTYSTTNSRHYQRTYDDGTWGAWKEWYIEKTIATNEIAENTDLDTLTDTGWYRCNTATIGATLINCPTNKAFAMEVYEDGKTSSGIGKYQRISTYDNPPKHYSRRLAVNGVAGTWQEWKLTDTTYAAATTSAAGLMSATDKTKLDGISERANVNVQADWNETDTTSDSYILNKPFTAISKSVTIYTSPWRAEYTDASDCKLASCIMTKGAPLHGGDGYTDFSLSIGHGSGSVFSKERTYNITLGTKLYAGTVNLKTGEVICTWFGVDGGLINWSLSSYSTDDKKIFVTGGLSDRLISDQADYWVVACTGYSFYMNGTSSKASEMPDMSIMARSNSTNVYFRDDRYSTVADFKAAMTGSIIVYALAENVTSQITPIDVRLDKGRGIIFNNDYDKGDVRYTLTYITEEFGVIVDALS